MRSLFPLAAALAACCIPSSVLAQDNERRPFAPEDVLRIHDVENIAIAPDGDWVAYTVSSIDLDDDSRSTDLYMVSWDVRDTAPAHLQRGQRRCSAVQSRRQVPCGPQGT
ncbi:MAG: hypothetical protein O7E52_28050 [Candidatus Poribacteria bacterium]|nr:hypothetical protein [Candidatus Poribacteria bacterium]